MRQILTANLVLPPLNHLAARPCIVAIKGVSKSRCGTTKNAASTKRFAGGVRSLPAHHQPAAPSRRRVALPEREGRQGKHPKRLERPGPPGLTRTAPGRFSTARA